MSHECVEMRLYRTCVMSAVRDRLVNVVNAVSCKDITVLLGESTYDAVVCTACDHEYLRLGTYVSELELTLLHTAGVRHE